MYIIHFKAIWKIKCINNLFFMDRCRIDNYWSYPKPAHLDPNPRPLPLPAKSPSWEKFEIHIYVGESLWRCLLFTRLSARRRGFKGGEKEGAGGRRIGWWWLPPILLSAKRRGIRGRRMKRREIEEREVRHEFRCQRLASEFLAGLPFPRRFHRFNSVTGVGWEEQVKIWTVVVVQK